MVEVILGDDFNLRTPRLSRNTTPAEHELTIKILKYRQEISYHERELADITNSVL